MERVLVIGCCGAGKTTLALRLGTLTGLPVIHLDQLYWRDNWKSVSANTFDALLISVLMKPRWVMDGNYNRTLALRVKFCDTVILLDYPRRTCLMGVLRRVMINHGRTRPDMGKNCPERYDRAFMRFVWNFRKDRLPGIYRVVDQARISGKRVIILKNRRDAKKFLQRQSASSAQR